MDCQQIEERLHAYLEEEIPQAEAAPIRAHLALCGRCRSQADDLEARALSLFPAPPEDVARKLEAEIVEELRRAPRRRKRRIAGAALVIALVVTGAVLLRPDPEDRGDGRGRRPAEPRSGSPGETGGEGRPGAGPTGTGLEIVGRIRATDGRDVPGAQVLVTYLDGQPAPDAWNTRSDAGGRFAIAGVDRDVFLQIRRSGYRTAEVALPGLETWVEEGRRSHGLTIALEEAGALHGTVLDEGGVPVPRVRVQARVPRGRPWSFRRTVPAVEEQSISAGDGEYRIDSVPVGEDVRLLAVAEGYALAWSDETVRLAGGREERRDIVLAPGGRILGDVLDASGEPRSGIDVHLFRPGARVPHAIWDRSRVDGRFEVNHLGLGDWEMRASEAGEVLWSREIQLSPEARESTVRVEMGAAAPPPPREGLVKGRALDLDGKPVEEAEVRVTGDGLQRTLGSAGGDFEVRLPEGAWTVEVTAPARTIAVFERITVVGGDAVDLGEVFLSPEPLLRGRVVTAEGTGLPGARVQLTELDGSLATFRSGSLWERVAEITSGPGGAFEMGGLDGRELWLHAEHPDYAPAGITVAGGHPAGVASVTLPRGLEVALEFVGPGGEAVTLPEFGVYAPYPLVLWEGRVASSQLFLRLAPGTYDALLPSPHAARRIIAFAVEEPTAAEAAVVRLEIPVSE